jgi:hypothetical protein
MTGAAARKGDAAVQVSSLAPHCSDENHQMIA